MRSSSLFPVGSLLLGEAELGDDPALLLEALERIPPAGLGVHVDRGLVVVFEHPLEGRVEGRLPERIVQRLLSAGAISEAEAALLRRSPMADAVVVEADSGGHTDNRPLGRGTRFKSNWELSSARAYSVLQFFLGEGVAPEKLSAVGYGEYKPVQSNETPEGRAKNRRIEIEIDFDEE